MREPITQLPPVGTDAGLVKSEMVGNAYAPEVSRTSKKSNQSKFRIRKSSRRSHSQSSRTRSSFGANPHALQKLSAFKQSSNGDIIRQDQFSSIYETSFNDAQPQFKPPKARLQLDNVKDIHDMKEIKTPFSYEEIVSRINGYSRGTFGQPFRP
jgi:hypothetical protein